MAQHTSIKDFVKAVSEGYVILTVVSLRKFGTSDQLKMLLAEVASIERLVRNEIIPEEDFEATRKKHFRLGNLRKARMVILNFARSHRIPI